jgi:chemotaxis protein histidine kinase CheA
MGRNEPQLDAAPSTGEAVEDRLAALKMRFRERALAEARALELALGELRHGPPELEVQGEIRRIAHSLCGGGGTFGYTGISARAEALEELVLDDPDSPALADACRALVAEVRRAAAATDVAA